MISDDSIVSECFTFASKSESFHDLRSMCHKLTTVSTVVAFSAHIYTCIWLDS